MFFCGFLRNLSIRLIHPHQVMPILSLQRAAAQVQIKLVGKFDLHKVTQEVGEKIRTSTYHIRI